jgi:hypothetical protein
VPEPRIKVDIICSYDQLKSIEDWCIENIGERWSAVRGNRNGRWAAFYNIEKSRNKRNGQNLTRGCVYYTFFISK